jgi:hypothetical protein
MTSIGGFLPGSYEVLEPTSLVRSECQHCIDCWTVCIVFIIAISGSTLTTTLPSISTSSTNISRSAIFVIPVGL